jgi:hypothetical protein
VRQLKNIDPIRINDPWIPVPRFKHGGTKFIEKPLDSHCRGNDGKKVGMVKRKGNDDQGQRSRLVKKSFYDLGKDYLRKHFLVIPAKAGIQ